MLNEIANATALEQALKAILSLLYRHAVKEWGVVDFEIKNAVSKFAEDNQAFFADLKTDLLTLLKSIAKASLEVEALFQEPVQLLTTGSKGSVTFSQKQTSCLVAHMFLCTTAL